VQARALVGLVETNRYDLIKDYVGLSPGVFDLLASTFIGERIGISRRTHCVTTTMRRAHGETTHVRASIP
jgi:hypothetical protein